MLVVAAILSILAGLLMPVVSRARNAAKGTVCAAKLAQIVQGIEMYLIDNDGYYPPAVDEFIKPYCSNMTLDIQRCLAAGDIRILTKEYTNSDQLFECPLDAGLLVVDFLQFQSIQTPTSSLSTGSSYWYNEVLYLKSASATSLWNPSGAAVIHDRTGAWHGGQALVLDDSQNPDYMTLYRGFRYTTGFADGHVKTITPRQLNAAKGNVYSDRDWIINIRLP